MIWFIISIILLVISVPFVVLYERKNFFDDESITSKDECVFVIASIIMFISFFFTALCCVFCAGFIKDINDDRQNIDDEICAYELEYRELSCIDIQAFGEDEYEQKVNDYNERVEKWKTTIAEEKVKLDSIWVGIFHSPVFREYTGDEFKYFVKESS